ncbi:MAG: hypothetical protein WC871_07370 [Bacteroidales bacterium]
MVRITTGTLRPSRFRLRLYREESGMTFTLFRSGQTRQRHRNGNVPPRIPLVNAPATSLPARPPVCSAPHIRRTPFIVRAENLCRAGYAATAKRAIWLCRVCHSTASRGAFHSKPRNTPCWQAGAFVSCRSVPELRRHFTHAPAKAPFRHL